MASHRYNADFFDTLVQESRNAANTISAMVFREIAPGSVLDVGCGRGVWLDAWRRQGVQRIMGIDGDYVDCEKLLVPKSSFLPMDLNSAFDLNEKFDSCAIAGGCRTRPALVGRGIYRQSGEARDLILFSAAIVGPGDEGHVNERPLEYWRELFARRGYDCYDWIRPSLKDVSNINPWYRYNTLVYANSAGKARLTPALHACRVRAGKPLAEFGDLRWRIRCAVLSTLPVNIVTLIAQLRASILARKYRRRVAQADS